MTADTSGIPSTREVFAQPASTSGLKPNVSRAVDGRRIPTGMRAEKQTRAMMSTIRLNIALPTLLFLLATSGAIAAQSANTPKPGVKGVQVQRGAACGCPTSAEMGQFETLS